METLRINGKEKQFQDGLPATLAQLLEQLQIDDATVVAELDGKIIERAQFAHTSLSSGQAIELVRFVPGG